MTDVRPKVEATGFNRQRIALVLLGIAALGWAAVIMLRAKPERLTPIKEIPSQRSRSADPVELLEGEDQVKRQLGGRARVEEIRPVVLGQGLETTTFTDRQRKAFSQPVKLMSGDRSTRGGSRRSEQLMSERRRQEDLMGRLEERSRQARTLMESVAAGGIDGFRPAAESELGNRRRPRSKALTLVEPAISPFTLHQGDVITGVLMTEINSDLAGQVTAQVSQDVYSSVGYHLLIPRGTKIVGSYDVTELGQRRLGVEWFRMIYPDGRSFDVPDFPGGGALGQTGLSGRVNHHTARLVGRALLFSAISAGLGSAQSSGASRLSAGDLALDGAARRLEDAAATVLERDAELRPTIRIRSGSRIKVFVTDDLAFVEPYRS